MDQLYKRSIHQCDIIDSYNYVFLFLYIPKISIQVSSRTLSRSSSILPPKSVNTMSIFISIWVHQRCKVPINVLHVLWFIFEVQDQMINNIGNRSWRNPLPSMHSTINPYRFIFLVTIGHLQYLRKTTEALDVLFSCFFNDS